jgi:hypothetical protein
VTVSVTLLVPTVVGVPLTVPVLDPSDNPGGSPVEPHPPAAAVQTYGVVPLLTTNVLVKATPLGELTAPGAVMAGNALITQLKLAESATPYASVTFTVGEKVPVAVGVPVIVPLVVSIDSPVGSELAVQVSGVAPPDSVTVNDSATDWSFVCVLGAVRSGVPVLKIGSLVLLPISEDVTYAQVLLAHDRPGQVTATITR